jgi:hypothetical protein
MADITYSANGITAEGSIGANFNLSALDANGIKAKGSIGCTFILGILHIATGITAISSIGNGGFFQQHATDCFIWASKKDEMNFTKDPNDLRSVVEVKRMAMSWSGQIYQIFMLSDVGPAVAYGKNGITLLKPGGQLGFDWGKQNLHPIGLKGKTSVVKTSRGHYFIDNNGFLGMVNSQGQVSLTDYSNYFSLMSKNLVMVYRNDIDVVHICDGTYGYVLTQWGLGKGPATLSGIGYKNDTLYAVTPSALVFAPFTVTTDIIDMQTRKEKVITGFEVGIATTKDLYGQVSYRWNKADAFYTTPWVKATRYGEIFIDASGIEFQFSLNLSAFEATQIDYWNVLGLTEGNIQQEAA